jgi:hypothetical protein
VDQLTRLFVNALGLREAGATGSGPSAAEELVAD